MTCRARAAEGPRGDDLIIYYTIHFISRRPLIGANTHSETAVNRRHNLTILSRRRRPISIRVLQRLQIYNVMCEGTQPTVRAIVPKLDARRIYRGRLYHGAFSVNSCVCIAEFISHRWKDMGEENAV